MGHSRTGKIPDPGVVILFFAIIARKTAFLKLVGITQIFTREGRIMKVIIVGATGTIGSAVVKAIASLKEFGKGRWFPDTRDVGGFGEDLAFCDMAEKAGIEVGLDPTTKEPYICALDLIGCGCEPADFVVSGTCSESLYGMVIVTEVVFLCVYFVPMLWESCFIFRAKLCHTCKTYQFHASKNEAGV